MRRREGPKSSPLAASCPVSSWVLFPVCLIPIPWLWGDTGGTRGLVLQPGSVWEAQCFLLGGDWASPLLPPTSPRVLGPGP